MTAPGLDRAALTGHTVVAVVPATEDVAWAVQQTWAIARTAATVTHRVALVDLSLTRPALDPGAVRTSDEGIVDAFLYDASLTRIAQPQDVPGLHYLGVGSPTTHPEEIWGHPRWGKLARGFESQGAILLLFVPPPAVPHLRLQPDGLIALAPGGLDAADAATLGLAPWIEAGVPLLATVTRADSPPASKPSTPVATTPPAVATAPSTATPARSAGRTSAPRPRSSGPVPRPAVRRPRGGWSPAGWQPGTRRLAFGLVVMVGVVGYGMAVLRPERVTPPVAPATDSAAVPIASPPTGAAAPTTPPPPPADTLFYSAQVAAFDTWGRALDHARALEAANRPSAVTPVRLRNTLWYRVVVGASPSAPHADSVLRALWRDGLVEPGQGTILRTPQAFDLGVWETDTQARAEVARLRAARVPAYAVRAPLGTRLWVGAFETPEQTAVAESLLVAAGLAATLTTRTGIAP